MEDDHILNTLGWKWQLFQWGTFEYSTAFDNIQQNTWKASMPIILMKR